MAAKDVVTFGLNIFLYKIISLSVISAENNYVVFSLFSKRSHTQAFYENTTLRLLLSMTTSTYGNNKRITQTQRPYWYFVFLAFYIIQC